jgi:heme oxygenase
MLLDIHQKYQTKPEQEIQLSIASIPILERLKSSTRVRHAALESRTVLLNKDLSQANYSQCLQRFFGYYAPLEKCLLEFPAWQEAGFVYDNRYKTQQIEHDLTALGLMQNVLKFIPQCKTLPELKTIAQLFGCLYVIEGATLGGQIISKHLYASLGLMPESGASFFAGYGQQTGSHWKAFCACMTAFSIQTACDDEIIASANKTFETLDYWLYPAQLDAIRKESTPQYE